MTDATAVALDEEFRELTPRATPAEQKALEAGLQRKGCQETLVLWPCQGRKLLLHDMQPRANRKLPQSQNNS
jgi:hypothetical protein